jgi:hypothetical protein
VPRAGSVALVPFDANKISALTSFIDWLVAKGAGWVLHETSLARASADALPFIIAQMLHEFREIFAFQTSATVF